MYEMLTVWGLGKIRCVQPYLCFYKQAVFATRTYNLGHNGVILLLH
uniref:Uncharacterized protein n=1 Tax=Rhizophora mucronata TaxID=61149 RepID=A0A2P2PDF5_RHIMU